MSDTNVIETAARRLKSALDALEEALERRREGDREQAELAGQIHALGLDRSRLANELDTAAARSRRLETTNREVVQRLDAAIDTIRTLLDAHER
jgi:chromosome segregation ATPase